MPQVRNAGSETFEKADLVGIWLPEWVWVGWGVSEVLEPFVTSLAIGKPSPRTESLVGAAVQWTAQTLLPLLGTLPQV
jgi:hypothetical protein